jgi:hypothetical protein
MRTVAFYACVLLRFIAFYLRWVRFHIRHTCGGYVIHAVGTAYMRWIILFTFFLILPPVYLPYLLLKKWRKSANNFLFTVDRNFFSLYATVLIFMRIKNVTTASCLCDWGISPAQRRTLIISNKNWMPIGQNTPESFRRVLPDGHPIIVGDNKSPPLGWV